MAKNTKLRPICHDPAECFGKNGKWCNILMATYPAGVPCPFRKADISNLALDGKEVVPSAEVEADAEPDQKPQRDFWEAFRYCSER